MKATALAPSNIAFTKYWGKKDEVLRLPENGSVSMCLSNLLTTTTVEFSDKYKRDQITILSLRHPELVSGSTEKIIKHLDRIRSIKNVILGTNEVRTPESSLFVDSGRARMTKSAKVVPFALKAKVVSQNNFPTGTGLSSSASGFAALTVAAASAAGLKLSEKELSILARQGSGSACRSIPSGFVEWLNGNTSETSYAKTIFPASHWKIADVVAVVSEGKKYVATTVGMQSAKSSPFMKLRLSGMKQKNELIKRLIKKKDFPAFGEFVEAESLELHAIMLTQTPPLIYWLPGTLEIMRLTRKWRAENLAVYFTVNTGQDIHLICEQKNVDRLKKELKKLDIVKDIIVNYPSEGARLSNKHLF